MSIRKPTRGNDMINEDHLKKTLSRTGGKDFKTSDNKLLPKPKHSCFGNFPPAKGGPSTGLKVEPVPMLAAAEASAADNQKGKVTSKYTKSPITKSLFARIKLSDVRPSPNDCLNHKKRESSLDQK